MIVEQTFEVPALSPALALILRMHGLAHDDVPQEAIENLELLLAAKSNEDLDAFEDTFWKLPCSDAHS